jgi:hypothetical protein
VIELKFVGLVDSRLFSERLAWDVIPKQANKLAYPFDTRRISNPA